MVILDQQKPFTVTAVTSDKMTVMPQATDKERPLTRDEIEGAWLALVQRGELSLMDVKHEFSDWSPVYITAVLAELPGVTYKIWPIVLFYTKQ